jgi:hypothetical protein
MHHKTVLGVIVVLAISFFTIGSALATKPGEEVNPNGFPSGEHYNLNVIGKKDGFTCPDQEYDESGNPIYGNVVFVPEEGPAKIYMESGKENGKGKKAEALDTVTELRVTDPCAFDQGGAVIQLPKNGAGYRVYARALAKPSDEPDIQITPQLVAVEDEYGNDLVYLGLVTDDGFETPYVSFTRKKGKSIAVDISGLFLWSGSVCYLDQLLYEEQELGFEVAETKDLCCTDSDGDGVFDECIAAPVDEYGNLLSCPTGYSSQLAFCYEYTDEWVFNIGDFVNYLWDTENNGVKLLQVRFYPN